MARCQGHIKLLFKKRLQFFYRLKESLGFASKIKLQRGSSQAVAAAHKQQHTSTTTQTAPASRRMMALGEIRARSRRGPKLHTPDQKLCQARQWQKSGTSKARALPQTSGSNTLPRAPLPILEIRTPLALPVAVICPSPLVFHCELHWQAWK